MATVAFPLETVPISPDTTINTGDSDTSTAMDEAPLTTVFHNPEHFNVKHPLMNKWTLWFTKPPSGKVCFIDKSQSSFTHSQ
jgi:translation initiation factor 4E